MRIRMLAVAGAAALVLAACGGDDGGAEPEVQDNPKFEAGSTMAELADSGKIKIGVKADQPGIGFKDPASGEFEGFDIEMGKIIAAELGIEEDGIEWIETVSDNREPFLQEGRVDIVIASYSITDDRRQVVGQAGPYYVTGQQLLVREEDKEKITGPDDLEGVKVCSVTGSTSIERVETEYGASPAPFATYSECVEQLQNNQVDAVTTDGAILLGYAAEAPDELEVVGDAFSEERYGIGFKIGDEAMCDFLKETIEKSYEDGTWEDAFAATLGEADVEAPEPPAVDAECFTS